MLRWMFAPAVLAAAILLSPARAHEPPTAAEAKSEGDRLREILDQKASLEVEEVPLRDLVPQLRELTKGNVIIEHRALQDIGLTAEVTVSGEFRDVSLRSILNLLLHPVELTWMVDDDALIITTVEETETRQSTRVYNVADLVAMGGGGNRDYDSDALVSLIESIVAPDTWDNVGGPASMESFRGILLIMQTEILHRQIDMVLETLRRGKRLSRESDGGPAARVSLPVRPDAEIALLDALQKPVSLDLENVPLSDLPSMLQDKMNVPAIIDRRALDDVGVDLQTPVSLTVQQMSFGRALRHLLRPLELTFHVRDEVLVITTPEEAETDLETRVFPVRDLADAADAQDPLVGRTDGYQRLMNAIAMTVAPDTWSEVGGPASMASLPEAGVVAISQTMHVHAQIEDLLASLRRKLAEPPPAATAEQRPRDESLELVIYNLPVASDQDAKQGQATELAIQHTGGFGGGFTHGPPIPGEDLVQIITALIEPESWNREDVYIRAVPGRLIVRHNEATQRQVKQLLSRLTVLHDPLLLEGGGFGGGGFF